MLLVTCFKNVCILLQQLLVKCCNANLHVTRYSLRVIKFVQYSLKKWLATKNQWLAVVGIIRYSWQELLGAKNHSSLVIKSLARKIACLKSTKLEETFRFSSYNLFPKAKKQKVARIQHITFKSLAVHKSVKTLQLLDLRQRNEKDFAKSPTPFSTSAFRNT